MSNYNYITKSVDAKRRKDGQLYNGVSASQSSSGIAGGNSFTGYWTLVAVDASGNVLDDSAKYITTSYNAFSERAVVSYYTGNYVATMPIASTSANGACRFDSTSFSVDSSGLVTLINSGGGTTYGYTAPINITSANKIEHNKATVTTSTASKTLTASDNTFVVVTLGYDDYGHISSKVTTTYTLPASASAYLYAASSATGTSNASATNPYLNLVSNSTVNSSIRFYGSGGTTVTSGSGYITIASTSYTSGSYITIYNGAISHNASGASAGTTSTSSGSVAAGGKVYIPNFTVDIYGHITSWSNNSVYLPADQYVYQSASTSASSYYILLSNASGVSGNALFSTKAYIQPSTGNIYSSGAVISYATSGSVATSTLATTDVNGICRFNNNYYSVSGGLVTPRLAYGQYINTLDGNGNTLGLLGFDSGYISIGNTASSTATLLKAYSAIYLSFNGSSNRYRFTSSEVDFSNATLYYGTMTQSSDIRLKTKLGEYKDMMSKVDRLEAFRFVWKDMRDELVHGGVSAQDMDEVFPEFVRRGSDNFLSVDYASAALCIAVAGLKELNAKIKRLEAKL